MTSTQQSSLSHHLRSQRAAVGNCCGKSPWCFWREHRRHLEIRTPSWRPSRSFDWTATFGRDVSWTAISARPGYGHENSSRSTGAPRSPSWWIEDSVCQSCRTGRRRGRRVCRSPNCRCPTPLLLPGALASFGAEARCTFAWCTRSWNRQQRYAHRGWYGKPPVRGRDPGHDESGLPHAVLKDLANRGVRFCRSYVLVYVGPALLN